MSMHNIPDVISFKQFKLAKSMKYFQEDSKVGTKQKGTKCWYTNIWLLQYCAFRYESCRWAAEAQPGYQISMECDYVFIFPVTNLKGFFNESLLNRAPFSSLSGVQTSWRSQNVDVLTCVTANITVDKSGLLPKNRWAREWLWAFEQVCCRLWVIFTANFSL